MWPGLAQSARKGATLEAMPLNFCDTADDLS